MIEEVCLNTFENCYLSFLGSSEVCSCSGFCSILKTDSIETPLKTLFYINRKITMLTEYI